MLKYLEEITLKEQIDFETDFKESVEVEFEGVTNGFLSTVIFAITGYDVEVIGEVEELFACPCCSLKTLTEVHGYDICAYCNWEDDGTTNINIPQSINKGSIEDYRKKLADNPNKFFIDKWFKN